MLGTHHCDRTIFPPDVSPLLKLMPPCPDATSVLISQSNSKANGITCPCVHFSSLSQKKKKKKTSFVSSLNKLKIYFHNCFFLQTSSLAYIFECQTTNLAVYLKLYLLSFLPFLNKCFISWEYKKN